MNEKVSPKMSDSDNETITSPLAYTPSHSTDSNDFRPFTSIRVAFDIYGGVGTVPEAGGTYIIRDIDSGRALTLEAGRLTLKREAGTNGGWRWECVEDADGWLGFREVVSYRYLGRDNRGGFYAEASKFNAWERFCLRPLKAGGYYLMAVRWWTCRRMGIMEGEKGRDRDRLVEVDSKGDAARWEFVEV